MRIFEKLNKTHVRFDNGDGTYFECPMFPIAKLPDIKQLEAEMEAAEDIASRLEVRNKYLELCREVFPTEKIKLLERFDLYEIADLANYLMYAWGDTEPDEDKKKVILPSQQPKQTRSKKK
jgi:hypothetical protein